MTTRMASGDVRDYSRLESTVFSRAAMRDLVLLVAGAGALGNEVIKNLALLGVGHLWIVDKDRVERSNLTRSVLYATKGIEEHLERRSNKADLATERAKEINPDVRAQGFPMEVGDVGLALYRRADIVLSCLDNESGRAEMSWACVRAGRLFVDAGLGVENYSSGLVSVYPGSHGPCYLCRKTEQGRREIHEALQGISCARQAAALEDAGIVATTPLTSSVLAALQVEFALRRRFEARETATGVSYHVMLHPRVAIEAFEFERNDDCMLHEPLDGSVVRRLDKRSGTWRVRDLIGEACTQGTLLLDWPVIVKARCDRCSHEWPAMQRRAKFQHTSCPQCGSTGVAGVEVVDAIDRHSPYADRTLTELGLPLAHVHTIACECHGHAFVEVTGDLADFFAADADDIAGRAQ